MSSVVGTLMSNFGLEQAFKRADIPFVRAKVGDRYVMEQLAAHNWLLGGESSGHIICQDITTTGDGIVSALQALAAVVHSGRSLADLRGQMRKFPQSMVNVRLTKAFDPAGNATVQSAITDIEHELGDKGRVLLRPSGTEPVLRVMVEGEHSEIVARLAQQLSEVVASEAAK